MHNELEKTQIQSRHKVTSRVIKSHLRVIMCHKYYNFVSGQDLPRAIKGHEESLRVSRVVKGHKKSKIVIECPE